MNIHIFSNGKYPKLDSSILNNLKKEWKNSSSLVVAADGGLDILKKIKLNPKIVVGDFDSIKNMESLKKLTPDTLVLTLPREKDYSDLYVASYESLNFLSQLNHIENKHHFFLWGSLGGRFDHSFSNLQLSYSLSKLGHLCTLIGEDEILTFLYPSLNNTYQLILEKNKTFSVFAYSQQIENLTIKNTKYKLENYTLYSDKPLGLSNESLSSKLDEKYLYPEITFSNGILLVVKELDTPLTMENIDWIKRKN